MELGYTLSAQNYNDYADRLHGLGKVIMDAGYELKGDGGVDWQNLLEQVLVRDISKKHFPHLIKNEIFNHQEIILEILDDAVDWVNPYSQKAFVFGKKNGALYPYVKRWFDWLKYNEKIVNGEIQKHKRLLCIEDGVEKQVVDINGNPIMTLEGYFGENTTN